MSSSATSPPGSPPPPYREDSGARITFSLGKVGGLISVDFIPGCTRAGGFVHGPEFEGFPVVLQRANQWLQSSGHLEIRTCEIPSVSVGWVSASASERLDTLIAKTNTLFMTNPGVLNEGSLFSRPKVETFPAVLGKVSSWLMQQQPLGFRLTNVQTLLFVSLSSYLTTPPCSRPHLMSA